MRPIAYVFGYGSLMYPSGINGRGMEHKYVWEDLLPARVIGYRRGMFALYYQRTYYGIMEASGRMINGVLLPIFSKEDLNALWLNEGAHSSYRNTKQGLMYEVREISSDVYIHTKSTNIDPQLLAVFALVNVTDKSKEGTIPPWYIANVWKGIEPWGEEFRHRFVKTGGIKPSRTAMMAAPIYNLCKPIRYIRRNIFR